MDNRNWRESIKKLNLAYLTIAKQIGANREDRGYAQTALGLDGATIKILVGLGPTETEKIAETGATLFRLKLSDLQGAQNFYKKGKPERAASLLAAGLVADCGKEEKR
jgi:hypothetical protein